MGNTAFSAEEVDEFKSDAVEMLDAAEEDLLALDKGAEFSAKYDAVFRVFHSLKGGAGMTGLSDLQEHMHKLENLLIQCKTSLEVMRENIGFFLGGIDAARRIVAGEAVSFEFKLSSASGQAAAKTKPIQPASAKTTSKLLVYAVDDEPDILDDIKDTLEEAGISVKTFTEPESVLGEIKSSRVPDVLLSDYMMPKMNGTDLLQAVRKIDHDLPVIFISGHLKKDVLLKMIESGIYAALEKPISESTLISHCLTAGRQYQLKRLLARSTRLLLYQYADLDDYLSSQGKHEIRQTIKTELDSLLKIMREMRI